MIAPPLTAERLLQSLSARTDFRDAILGDLAEEYAERVESDGTAAARRWYYREAMRAAPHILLHWARSLRVREVRRLVYVFFGSYFLVLVLVTVLFAIVRGTLETLGVTVDLFARSSHSGASTYNLTLAAPIALMYGYVAASLDRKTPLASAILFGIFWASLSSVLTLIFSMKAPMWYLIGGTSIMLVGTTVGGMLQVRNTRFENGAEYLEWRNKHIA